MAKLFKIDGFKTVIRLDRVDAVERVDNGKGEEHLRIFMSGMDGGYTINFGKYGEMADKAFNDIVKEIEEL